METRESTAVAAVTVDLAAQLVEAESKLTEAVRAKRISDSEINEATAAVAAAERALRGGGEIFRSRNQGALNKARSRFEKAQKTLAPTERAVEEAQATLNRVRDQIAKCPERVEALAAQRTIVAEGIEAAARAWTAPLPEVSGHIARFDAIMEQENTFIFTINRRLETAGIPKLSRKLYNVRHALPLMIVDFDLPRLAVDASKILKSAL